MDNSLVKAMIAEACSAFLLLIFCNKSANHIFGNVIDDASVWRSRLYHVNFGLMSRLSSMCLIPKFTIAKG